MGIILHKPTTPGRRFASITDRKELTKKRPEKKLLVALNKNSGRNNQGRITVRHRGGGHARFYRTIDNRRIRFDQPAKIVALEYDPNRTAWLALIQYANGDKSYIIAPNGMKVGETVVTSRSKAEITVGNRLPLGLLPVGITVHDVELFPNTSGTIIRSAGSGAVIQAVEGETAQLKLPSGEVRVFNAACLATIGQVSNIDHENIRLGKAGRTRWRGIKPTVRGKAMNPVDHPHGGGEGHNPIGLKHPKTPWGKPALGVKTRKAGKYSDALILQRRK
ncbi:MAG: 50S ribosomal protein L2 [Patescibacteria group bacterium]